MGTFELRCTDCSFSDTVEGNLDTVYDEIEAHRDAYEDQPLAHFVDFERLDE